MKNEEFKYDGSDFDDDSIFGSFDHSGVDSGEDDDSQDWTEEDLKLGMVKFLFKDDSEFYHYNLIFTVNPEEFWGEGFEYQPVSLVNEITPDEKYVHKVVEIKSTTKLCTVIENSCLSYQDAIDGVIALAWTDLSCLDVYPDYRLVVMFGEPYRTVEDKFARINVLLW